MASRNDLTGPWIEIDAQRFAGGQRFIMELEKLGLLPDVACWFRDESIEEFRLAIVTPVVEIVGARLIYKTLFRAHSRALLPREIDPLMVELFDKSTYFALELRRRMPIAERAPTPITFATNPDGGIVQLDNIGSPETQIIIDNYRVSTKWIYRANWERHHKLTPEAEFKMFEKKVSKQQAA